MLKQTSQKYKCRSHTFDRHGEMKNHNVTEEGKRVGRETVRDRRLYGGRAEQACPPTCKPTVFVSYVQHSSSNRTPAE